MKEFTIKPQFKYERHILNLLNMEGFYQEWISRLNTEPTHEAAYEATERFFEAHFEERRFASYDSFRSSVSQWLKKKKNDSKN